MQYLVLLLLVSLCEGAPATKANVHFRDLDDTDTCGDASQTVGVKVNGATDPSCGGPANECGTIGAALASTRALSIQAPCIRLAAGTYLGTQQSAASITRPISITGQGSSLTAIDMQGQAPLLNVHSVLTIRNLTIMNGGENPTQQGGGTIYVSPTGTLNAAGVEFGNNSDCAVFGDTGSTLVLSNCIFRNNSQETSGGAVSCFECQRMSVSSSAFLNNSIDHDGAAIWMDGSPTVIVEDSTFIDNSAGRGAGLHGRFMSGVDLTVTNCTFKHNAAVSGGGIYLTSNTGDVTGQILITSSLFHGNYGGRFAVYYPTQGAALYVDSTNHIPVHVVDCQFEYNFATNGGAVATQRYQAFSDPATMSGLEMTNCIFHRNIAMDDGDTFWGREGGGGAICVLYSAVKTRGCVFVENSASVVGGGVWMYQSAWDSDADVVRGNVAGYGGGGIAFSDTCLLRSNIQNMIVSNNTATDPASVGGGVLMLNAINASFASLHASGNTAGSGGGMAIISNTSAALMNVVSSVLLSAPSLINNTATAANASVWGTFPGGGGLYVQSTAVTVAGVGRVEGNSGAYGGGILSYQVPTNTSHAWGGGQLFQASDMVIQKNKADEMGGALAMMGPFNAVVANARVTGNVAKNGAGIYAAACDAGERSNCSSGHLIMSLVILAGNTAQQNGGAVYVEQNVSVSCDGCGFAGNVAHAQGRDLYTMSAWGGSNSAICGNYTSSALANIFCNASVPIAGIAAATGAVRVAGQCSILPPPPISQLNLASNHTMAPGCVCGGAEPAEMVFATSQLPTTAISASARMQSIASALNLSHTPAFILQLSTAATSPITSLPLPSLLPSASTAVMGGGGATRQKGEDGFLEGGGGYYAMVVKMVDLQSDDAACFGAEFEFNLPEPSSPSHLTAILVGVLVPVGLGCIAVGGVVFHRKRRQAALSRAGYSLVVQDCE